MAQHAPTTFDLFSVLLEIGETRTFEIRLYLPPLHLAGQDYGFDPDTVPAQLAITYVGGGYTAAMKFSCRLAGVCWRCLEAAELELDIEVEDFFERDLPPEAEMGEAEEATLFFLNDGVLDLSEWAMNAVAEQLPPQILCSPECQGLCVQCGTNLNLSPCSCELPADSRWDKLKEWRAD